MKYGYLSSIALIPLLSMSSVLYAQENKGEEASIEEVARDIQVGSIGAQQRHDLGETLTLDVRVDVLLQQVKQQKAAARRDLSHDHPLTPHAQPRGDPRREGLGRSADWRR